MVGATVAIARRSLTILWLLTATLSLIAGVDAQAGGRSPYGGGRSVAQPSALPSPQEDGMFRVLVKLKSSFRPEGLLSANEQALQRANIRALQQGLLSRLPASGHTVIAAYEIFPVIALEVDAGTLALLQSAPDVESVHEDVPMRPADIGSSATVHVSVPWSQGYDGTGWAVAVLDTGVQTTHPFLAGKTIAEACFSTTSAGQKSVSVCPNGQSTSGSAPGQSGSGAGINCDATTIEGCDHGTHVAGIAVGKDYAGGPGFDGIARGAKLIAIQVFSKFTTSQKCGGPPPCVLSYTSDQIAALQYVYSTVRPAFGNIASVNMSLGGGQYTAPCDTSTLKPAVDTLRSVNIATVIASGNDGLTDAISAPGCISTAVSVGATDDADDIASFSNRASFMSLFAPGVAIDSSIPVNAFANFSGTSMATPLVAGAFALVKHKNPAFSVAQTLSLLQSTGQPIAIEGGAQIPRVRLGDAFGVPTLDVDVTKTFLPGSIAYGGTSLLTITLSNPNPVPLTGVAFSDAYPGGMTNSASPAPSNSCGGTMSAAPWYPSLSLAGGTIPANGSCTLTVQVTAIGTSGSIVNTIPVRALTSTNGGENNGAATGALTLAPSSFMVQDGGFELGAAATPWVQTSTNFTTPLCDASCGVDPRTGVWFAWFGGTTMAETGTLTQTRVIPPGPKMLNFYLWWASAQSATATFKVFIDGTPILSLTGATSAPYGGGYTRVAIDVSGYADGNSHTLKFEQVNAANTGYTNIFLDDVALTSLPPGYTVTFDSNGGTAVSSQTVAQGGTATQPSAPTKAGNTFAGWYSDPGLTSAFNFSTPITGDITLHAKWTLNNYTVSFNSNGGSAVGSQSVPYGSTATQPTAPLKTGSSFAGWYSNAGLTSAFSFSTPITGDITLYAKWTLNNYTVSFNSNGGSAVNSQIVAYGNTASQPAAPTKTGNTFAGWYSDPGLTSAFNFSTPITADITLHAKWTLNNYTVSFNSNGGSAVSSQIVAYGNTASQPAAPTKTGSTFSGWYSDPGLTSAFNFATPITSNITLYAKWTLNNYTVSFISNGGSAVSSQVVAYGNTASQPAAPTKTGNTFGGWYSDAGLTSAFSFATPITGDITLYAKWTLNNYTVSFNSNGGSAVSSLIVAYGNTASQPSAPAKTGNTFAGWYSDPGLTSAFSFATPITADITLYAKWTLNNYTVTFNSNGGTAVTSQIIAFGNTASQPTAPTKTGSTFAGWYSDAGLTTAFSFATPITADITLHAKWTLNTYTVSFDSNGGSAVGSQVVAYGSTATVPVAPTKPANSFGGWYADAGLTSAFSFATPISADITLYAKWNTQQTLDIDGNGSYDALTDGVLTIRYMFGLTGQALVDGALGAGASRTQPQDVIDYLSGFNGALDIDGNGETDALTDGLLIIRYLFGLRGNSLIQNAIGANATRSLAADIESYLAGLTP